MEHLGHVKEGILRDIASWTTFPADTVQVLEDGLREVLAGAEPGALERERDEALAAFITARARARRVPLEPVVATGTSAEVIEIAPGATRATLACGERTTMVRFDLAAGADIPPHRHVHEQTGYLVSGDLLLIASGREWPVSAGDSWSIPGGLVHGGHSQRGAVAVEVFAPARAEYLPGPPPSPARSD